MSPAVPARARLRAAAAAACALALFAGFVALGNWQLARRSWKLDLIDRVERRVHAAPVAIPAPAQWASVSAARDEYRRVRVEGRLLRERQTLVHASTALGSGYWVLTPLALADGHSVLINRGFVPAGWREAPARAGDAPVAVTGLLRLSEPGGTLLQRNDPAAGRWYSRDVAAIAAARGLAGVAPFFIDAEAPPPGAPGAAADASEPVAGLTVLAFPNNHLVYALTWYGLAALVVLAAGVVVRTQARARPEPVEARS